MLRPSPPSSILANGKLTCKSPHVQDSVQRPKSHKSRSRHDPAGLTSSSKHSEAQHATASLYTVTSRQSRQSNRHQYDKAISRSKTTALRQHDRGEAPRAASVSVTTRCSPNGVRGESIQNKASSLGTNLHVGINASSFNLPTRAAEHHVPYPNTRQANAVTPSFVKRYTTSAQTILSPCGQTASYGWLGNWFHNDTSPNQSNARLSSPTEISLASQRADIEAMTSTTQSSFRFSYYLHQHALPTSDEGSTENADSQTGAYFRPPHHTRRDSQHYVHVAHQKQHLMSPQAYERLTQQRDATTPMQAHLSSAGKESRQDIIDHPRESTPRKGSQLSPAQSIVAYMASSIQNRQSNNNNNKTDFELRTPTHALQTSGLSDVSFAPQQWRNYQGRVFYIAQPSAESKSRAPEHHGSLPPSTVKPEHRHIRHRQGADSRCVQRAASVTCSLRDNLLPSVPPSLSPPFETSARRYPVIAMQPSSDDQHKRETPTPSEGRRCSRFGTALSDYSGTSESHRTSTISRPAAGTGQTSYVASRNAPPPTTATTTTAWETRNKLGREVARLHTTPAFRTTETLTLGVHQQPCDNVCFQGTSQIESSVKLYTQSQRGLVLPIAALTGPVSAPSLSTLPSMSYEPRNAHHKEHHAREPTAVIGTHEPRCSTGSEHVMSKPRTQLTCVSTSRMIPQPSETMMPYADEPSTACGRPRGDRSEQIPHGLSRASVSTAPLRPVTATRQSEVVESSLQKASHHTTTSSVTLSHKVKRAPTAPATKTHQKGRRLLPLPPQHGVTRNVASDPSAAVVELPLQKTTSSHEPPQRPVMITSSRLDAPPYSKSRAMPCSTMPPRSSTPNTYVNDVSAQSRCRHAPSDRKQCSKTHRKNKESSAERNGSKKQVRERCTNTARPLCPRTPSRELQNGRTAADDQGTAIRGGAQQQHLLPKARLIEPLQCPSTTILKRVKTTRHKTLHSPPMSPFFPEQTKEIIPAFLKDSDCTNRHVRKKDTDSRSTGVSKSCSAASLSLGEDRPRTVLETSVQEKDHDQRDIPLTTTVATTSSDSAPSASPSQQRSARPLLQEALTLQPLPDFDPPPPLFCPKKASVPASLIGCALFPPNHTTLRYRLLAILQSAIYGAVYYASEDVQLSEGKWFHQRCVAVKMMVEDLVVNHKGETQEDMTAEVRFREAMCGHTNILIHDLHWEDRGAIFLVMPYAELGDLFDALLRRATPLTEPEARWLFSQLLSGAVFLQERGIAFRDHSLENVLLFRAPRHHGLDSSDEVLIPRITDPGQAIPLEYDASHNVKKIKSSKLFGKSFRPPEAYLGRHYDPTKVDAFCLGWMLFFSLTKRQAFHRALLSDVNWALIVRRRYSEFLKKTKAGFLSTSVCSLLWKMLDPDPTTRLGIKDCQHHPWFQGPHTPLTVASFGMKKQPSVLHAGAMLAVTQYQSPLGTTQWQSPLKPTSMSPGLQTATTTSRQDPHKHQHKGPLEGAACESSCRKQRPTSGVVVDSERSLAPLTRQSRTPLPVTERIILSSVTSQSPTMSRADVTASYTVLPSLDRHRASDQLSTANFEPLLFDSNLGRRHYGNVFLKRRTTLEPLHPLTSGLAPYVRPLQMASSVCQS